MYNVVSILFYSCEQALTNYILESLSSFGMYWFLCLRIFLTINFFLCSQDRSHEWLVRTYVVYMVPVLQKKNISLQRCRCRNRAKHSHPLDL